MTIVEMLARRRVALGFVAGITALALANPSYASLLIGAIVAACGELIRIWAAGHLEKGREVTTAGPYRFTRHPLYLGSAIMAAGFIIAARSAAVAVIAVIYFALTYGAAIRREEAFLTAKFGDAYPDYRAGRMNSVARPFAFSRVMRNHEYRAIAGLVAAFAILATRLILS